MPHPPSLRMEGFPPARCRGEELVIAPPPPPELTLQGGKPQAPRHCFLAWQETPPKLRGHQDSAATHLVLPSSHCRSRMSELPLGQPLRPPGMHGPDVHASCLSPEVTCQACPGPLSSTSMRDSSTPAQCVFTGFPRPSDLSPMKAGILCVLFVAQGPANFTEWTDGRPSGWRAFVAVLCQAGLALPLRPRPGGRPQ